MKRCVPTAPVESDGAKSVSESPCQEERVPGARFSKIGEVSARDGFAPEARALVRS